MACGFYCAMVAALLGGIEPEEAYLRAVETTQNIYIQTPYSEELTEFSRVFKRELPSLSEADIRSSGYVIDTLEASIWCLLKSSSFEGSVLKAVNLGEDTDTTATVTGGLAGVIRGACARIDHVEPDLTLWGLREVYLRNK